MRALVSVYDKTGVVELGQGLAELGVELVATGKTAAMLSDAGLAVIEVADVTGYPEMLDDRVKTLHPAIHGGILADRSIPGHLAELEAAGIAPIDLVVANLYPFFEEPSIATIDIGGVTLIRAAAKNHAHVAVVVNPAEYETVLGELRADGEVSAESRRRLARAGFAHTAAYDAAITTWFDSTAPERVGTLPDTIHLALERAEVLRYGENPHQLGARYRSIGASPGFWEEAVCHGGRELSYLNLFDAEAAWRLVHELRALDPDQEACVVVKHANPCGAAFGADLAEAYERAFEGDPLSAFGGIIAFGGPVDLALAEKVVAHPLADVLIASSYSSEALELFGRRRRNMRPISAAAPGPLPTSLRVTDGGYLVQSPDLVSRRGAGWQVVAGPEPTPAQWADAELANLVCARTGSNAIVLANDGQIVGVGCGQPSRVDSAEIAGRKANGRAAGGAAASDAFFPFRDGLDSCVASGVRVVVHPGGSARDDEVIAAANEAGVTLVATGERHFRH